MKQESAEEVMVSVVIPVYHLEKYIARCIHSLQRQTLKETEFIFICEQADPTYSIIKGYRKKDKRIRLINFKNRGVSASRNVGIRESRGRYVIFVDGDDWVEPNMCRVLSDNADWYKADIVVFGIWPNIEPARNKAGCFQNTVKRNILYDHSSAEALIYERGSRPYIGNKFYRRRMLTENDIKFREDMEVGEDQFFQFVAFEKAERICFLREKFYHYDVTRATSTMHVHEAEKSLLDKNMYLIEQTVAFSRRHTYITEEMMTWWILEEFSGCLYGMGEEECMRTAERLAEQLNNVHALKWIKLMSSCYQNCYENIIKLTNKETHTYKSALNKTESDRYRKLKTWGLGRKIKAMDASIIRRVEEFVLFHEGRRFIYRLCRKLGFNI